MWANVHKLIHLSPSVQPPPTSGIHSPQGRQRRRRWSITGAGAGTIDLRDDDDAAITDLHDNDAKITDLHGKSDDLCERISPPLASLAQMLVVCGLFLYGGSVAAGVLGGRVIVVVVLMV